MADVVQTIALATSESELEVFAHELTRHLSKLFAEGKTDVALSEVRNCRRIAVDILKSLGQYEDDLIAQQAPEGEYYDGDRL